MSSEDTNGQSANKFSKDERKIMETIFNKFDSDNKGFIRITDVPSLLESFGQDKGASEQLLEEVKRRHAHINDDNITFSDLISILESPEHHNHKQTLNTSEESVDYSTDFENSNIISNDLLQNKSPTSTTNLENNNEDTDEKVLEFLKILEEYRVKCEDEGNYLEAGRAYKQLTMLRKQEEKRQQKIIRMKQLHEREEIQNQQNKQYEEFNVAWDKYMNDYDKMAQQYILQMTERHAMGLLELQEKLREEVVSKPPRFSKELIDMRRKQITAARNKQYKEAQQLKKLCDQLEDKEMAEMEQTHAVNFARREAKFRVQQQAELQALLKRIEMRRKEHVKQRQHDSKRLLQRNRNIQASLESQHVLDQQKLFDSLKKQLNSITPTYNEDGPANIRNLKTAEKEVNIILDKKRKDTVQQNKESLQKAISKESFLPNAVKNRNNPSSSVPSTADQKRKTSIKNSNSLPTTPTLHGTHSSSNTPSNSAIFGNISNNSTPKGTASGKSEEGKFSDQDDPAFLHASAPVLHSDGNVTSVTHK